MPGHWKAECPRRHAGSSPPDAAPKQQTANTLINVQEFSDDDDADVFVMAPTSRDQAVCTESHLSKSPPKENMIMFGQHSKEVVTGTANKYKMDYYHQVRSCVTGVLNAMPTSATRNPPVPESDPTPSCKNLGQSDKPAVVPCKSLERPTEPKVKDMNVSKEAIFFATVSTSGILDLGASQTVMGEHQLEDFLQGLPCHVRSQVFERPVNMTFRFGNNSTVPCSRAVFVPIDQYWIKIAIVSSRTPFLISNNVCRSLGAVIDCENHDITFRRLQCSMPLTLSGKKLFLLDFGQLTRLRPPTKPISSDQKDEAADQSESVFQQHTEPMQPSSPLDTCTKNTSSSVDQCNSETRSEMVTCVNESCNAQVPAPELPCDLSESTCVSHGQDPCRALSAGAREPVREDLHPGPDQSAVRGTSGTCDPLWNSQSWSPIPPSGSRGSSLLQMVPDEVSELQQEGTCGICPLSSSMDRKDGDMPVSRQDQSQGSPEQPWEVIQGTASDHELRRRMHQGQRLGCPIRARTGESDIGARTTSRPDGTRSEASDWPIASHVSEDGSASSKVACPALTHHLRQCISEYQQFMQDIHVSDPIARKNQNTVLLEMLEYAKHPKHARAPQSGQIDVLEIYCSGESELTKQGRRQGLRVLRFGLNQGDLSTYEGRCRLYDILFQCKPRHIWMSPKCTAWSKWNIFNAGKSTEMAQKVMRARGADEIHLLLCEAVFIRQCMLGPEYHFHLEQPVGSEMLFQESMQVILDHTMMARCDMCVAGNLIHPNTQKPLQKGTQVLTTSSILAQYLSSWRCPRDHEHHQVAGSCTDKYGNRQSLTSFTELYTSTFAHRVVRTIIASLKIQEQNPLSQHVTCQITCPAHATNHEDEPDAKRRRVTGKSKTPPAYADTVPEVADPANNQPEVTEPVVDPKDLHDTILKEALSIGPRVGKLVIEGGPFFDMIQKHYPNKVIRLVEISKGTDRFRKPPIRLPAQDAPWRKSFGIRRDNQETFHQEPEWVDRSKWSVTQHKAKSPPARILVTIFARDSSVSEIQPIAVKRPHEEGVEESLSKRNRTLEEDEMEHPPNPTETKLDDDSNCKHDTIEKLHESTLSHGARFKALDTQTRQWITRLHYNLGHPGMEKLKHVLSNQGYPSEIIDALKDFRCGTCHEVQAPRIARPAHLAEVREFNDCIGVDLVQWTSAQNKQFRFLHVIDFATNFQQAVPVFQTDAESLWDAISAAWIHWAGPCKELVIDNDSALCSDRFSEILQQHNVVTRIVAAYAHWQMGKTERHGDIIQSMLHKYHIDNPINDDQAFKTALVMCCNAKNALARHKGYTPEILVLGKSRPLPASNCADHPEPAHFSAENNTPEGIAFRQQLWQRECARKAFVDADNSEKLRRAFLRRQRPHRGHFSSGSFVMFWRPGRGEAASQWIGPARVIIQESDHIVWITHSSKVYRVAPEHIRWLSEREASQCLPQAISGDLDQSFSPAQNGVFRYDDLTSQPRPINPEIPIIPEDSTAEISATPPTGNTDANPISIPSSQPDTEPEHEIPNSNQPSFSYAPTSPLSSLMPETISPVDIPVPEDEDLYCDFWILQTDRLIRVHQQPRWTAFEPHLCTDCPVDILCLAEDRTTMAKSDKGEWSCQEAWYATPWTSDTSWTGISIFHIVPCDSQESETQTETILHVEENHGFVCEVFLAQRDFDLIKHSPAEFPVHVASAAKRQRAEVRLQELTPEQVQEFDKAKVKEVDQWLSTETVKRIFRNQIPEENILRCRWVLTWKDLDEIDAAKEGKTRKAKARLVILGFEDPNITDIPRDSPTLQKESRSLLLQMCASRRWKIQSFDVKTAFLRGSRRDNRILGVEPPKEMRDRMKLKDSEICELLKSAYGLVNAPYLWYQELKENLCTLHFEISPMDPCLFVLTGDDDRVHGYIGMHVDDGLCCGDSVFESTLAKLEQKFPFGSKRKEKFTFTGIQISQQANFDIVLSQKEYVLAVDPISVDRHRRKDEKAEVTDDEKQQLCGLIGSLQYAATNSRPDISARLSFLQSRINCALISDLLEANRMLADAKKYADTCITIKAIPVEDVHLVSYSDASFATREKKQSQKGGLFLAVHKDILEQKSADASTLTWYSKKIDRVVASTLAAETFSLSAAVDSLNWLRLVWEWLKNPKIDWKKPEHVWNQSPQSIAVMDCKSLFDVLVKNTTPQCQEHRTLLEALVIKDHVKHGIKPYWVHSAAQLADALTKIMDCFRLREFLSHTQCCLRDITEILKQRADRKAQKSWISIAPGASVP